MKDNQLIDIAVVDPLLGTNIKSAASAMVGKLCTHAGAICDFNGIRLSANKGTTVADILAD